LRGEDDWNAVAGVAGCPKGAGPDYDFASAPNAPLINASSGLKTVVGAGQKSGIYSVFDADTGALLWAKQVGPGSTLGGMEWGSATDGRRVYVAISNYSRDKYTGGMAGSWSALNPATGDIMWHVSAPNNAVDLGPVAVANGVVFAGSMAFAPGQDNMYARLTPRPAKSCGNSCRKDWWLPAPRSPTASFIGDRATRTSARSSKARRSSTPSRSMGVTSPTLAPPTQGNRNVPEHP
jgi:hypothetical protein